MRKHKNCFISLMLASAMLFSSVIGKAPVNAVEHGISNDIEHGTADFVITKDMLKNTPPEDYQVDMAMQAEAKDKLYDKFFLDDALQTVKIDVDENNLNYIFQNALDKPSVMTDSVTIGDSTIKYAGLKTKGNYTLEHTFTDNPGNDRFSFTINFGKYIKKKQYGVKQNFYGCNKISFNNFFFDRTMMKEFFAMKLLDEMGVATPRYGLCKLYINEQYYGVYFMVEAMDSSIIERYSGLSANEVSSYIVKPEDTQLIYNSSLDKFITEDGTFDLSEVLIMDDKGDYTAQGLLSFSEGLWEKDNDTLQDVADMLPTVLSWEKKLTFLSRGEDFSGNDIDVNSDKYIELLDTVIDIDEVLRYFAASSFLVQLDNMFTNDQNFGLYVDNEGKAQLISWDYDLCFGCYYPSEAEATANYDIDTMYFDYWIYPNTIDTEDSVHADIYNFYPIFNVIYQNKSLLEKYHQYIKECSKIATLGGTVSNGKSYEPGNFNSYIEKFTPLLEEAASEELASNVWYIGVAGQPEALLLGLPNLSKIIAMRSVGTAVQVDGIDTIVSGVGCDLSTLGNAGSNIIGTSGDVTAVDSSTGIYVRSDYTSLCYPEITVTKLGKNSEKYQAAKESIGCTNEENLIVYKITNTEKSNTKYRISIPLDSSYNRDYTYIYSYTADKTTKLNLTFDDNIATGKTESISYIAVLKTAGEENLKNIESEDDSTDEITVEKTVKLNKTTLKLKVGKTYKLKLKNAEDSVVWSSNNKKIATVKNGKVTAKKKGQTVIKAKSAGKTYKCTVKVTN